MRKRYSRVTHIEGEALWDHSNLAQQYCHCKYNTKKIKHEISLMVFEVISCTDPGMDSLAKVINFGTQKWPTPLGFKFWLSFIVQNLLMVTDMIILT